MKRNLSTVGRGDEGKSLLTASGKVVHKIRGVQDYSLIMVVTYCGRMEYPRQNRMMDAAYGTWYSTAHCWYTPVTCQRCIDGEKMIQAEALGHSVSITRRNLGIRWGATRASYGRNVKCSCTWKIYSNESQEGSAKLDRWAEQRKLEHLLTVWEQHDSESRADVEETLGEGEPPRFSDGSVAPIDLINP
jgi:hypothetical protein